MTHEKFLEIVRGANRVDITEGNFNHQPMTKNEERDLKIFLDRQEELLKMYSPKDAAKVMYDEYVLRKRFKEVEKDEER